jgi:hypothetical protein
MSSRNARFVPKADIRIASDYVLFAAVRCTTICSARRYLMRLIKPAIYDVAILRMVVHRHYGADKPGRLHRRRLLGGRFPRAVLRHCFRWHRLRLSLAMRDELGIAGRTRPGRYTIGQAASPMRPTIGDKAAAVCEIKPDPEHNRRFKESLMGHIRCRISRLTQGPYLSPSPDGQHSWRDYGLQHRMRFASFSRPSPEEPMTNCKPR